MSIYLYVIFAGYNAAITYTRAPFSDEAACLKALSEAKVAMSPGSENENVVTMFCGVELEERTFDNRSRERIWVKGKSR